MIHPLVTFPRLPIGAFGLPFQVLFLSGNVVDVCYLWLHNSSFSFSDSVYWCGLHWLCHGYQLLSLDFIFSVAMVAGDTVCWALCDMDAIVTSSVDPTFLATRALSCNPVAFLYVTVNDRSTTGSTLRLGSAVYFIVLCVGTVSKDVVTVPSVNTC